MVLGIGYVASALGPVIAGVGHDLTGSFTATLTVLPIIAVLTMIVALGIPGAARACAEGGGGRLIMGNLLTVLSDVSGGREDERVSRTETSGCAISASRLDGCRPGAHNAITDVAGVRVGHTTLMSGEGPLHVGEGPVRTGVTVIQPHEGDVGLEPVFAGYHVFNGNGEMTGLLWVKESGLLTTPIAITNTHSVGVVRDAIIAYEVRTTQRPEIFFSLPVVAETYDGWLNDINGMHVKPEHVWAALDAAADGPVAEGCVGGGTGMICHEFKGGIGTVLPRAVG